MGQNGCFGSKNGILGVFWKECDVADRKQSTKITTVDHRNKIQLLVKQDPIVGITLI